MSAILEAALVTLDAELGKLTGEALGAAVSAVQAILDARRRYYETAEETAKRHAQEDAAWRAQKDGL